MKPYYAVIFTSVRKNKDPEYHQMAQLMEELVVQQSGYLGHETASDDMSITISYWETLEDIAQWKSHTNHQMAQRLGKKDWYSWYRLRVCKVERDYEFNTTE